MWTRVWEISGQSIKYTAHYIHVNYDSEKYCKESNFLKKLPFEIVSLTFAFWVESSLNFAELCFESRVSYCVPFTGDKACVIANVQFRWTCGYYAMKWHGCDYTVHSTGHIVKEKLLILLIGFPNNFLSHVVRYFYKNYIPTGNRITT